jgi:vitamin B12 transporter
MNRESELTNRYDNTNYNSQRTNNSFREDTTSLISGAEMLATYTSKAGSTSFSAGAEQQKWEGQTITRPDHNSPIFASVDASAKILRAAVEHEVRPLERLGLVAGIGVAQQDRSSARDTDYTYRLATTYDLTPATLIRLQHARQLRFPSLRDLYRTDGGNPDLKTEQTMHYELGIEQQLSFFDSRIGAAIFQIDAENFITRNNTTNLLDNLDQSRTRGFELFASAKPVPDFFVRTGYTYLDARNLSQGAAVDTIQHVPEHKVTLDTSYRFTTGLTATLSCMRVMNNYTTNDTNTAFKNVGDYSIVNVGLSQEVLGGKGALFARVHNLFDANYQDSYGFNQAGRTFFAGARVNF